MPTFRHMALQDQRLQALARKVGNQFSKGLVEPHAILRLAYGRFNDGNPRTHWVET
ncbi:hypothetical protein [Sphingobium sp. LSP13-1-1.1]|uniref:hypothetical protein n=1 Tax=Sphingobium sp. LSP13-1-1.1 TaxID=3135234 RepID=UPI00342470D1